MLILKVLTRDALWIGVATGFVVLGRLAGPNWRPAQVSGPAGLTRHKGLNVLLMLCALLAVLFLAYMAYLLVMAVITVGGWVVACHRDSGCAG